MNNIIIYRNQLFKGSEGFIKNQAESLRKYNPIYVGRRVVGQPPGGVIVKTICHENSIVERLSEIYNICTGSSSAYYKKINGLGIKLVHAHFAIDALYALDLSKKLDVPLITTLHGFDVTTDRVKFISSCKPSWIFYGAQAQKLKKQGDVFLCVSDFIKKKAIAAGFNEKKLRTHYIGIDLSRSEQSGYINDNEKTILHVARLVEKKGTADLISAIGLIKNKLNGFKVKIIGNGPLYDQLNDMIKSLGLVEYIELLGEKSNELVFDELRKASFLLVPSITSSTGDSEGLPTVIMEAASIGVPTIGTIHAGIPEAIIDEKTGLLIPESEIGMLAERILFLINNPNYCSELGVNAREYMKEKFNLRKQTEILESFYDEF